MNKRQSNKLNSYQSVKGVLEDNRPIYEPVPIINQSVESFFKVVNEVDTIATRTEMDTTGETSAKIVAKEKLATSGSVFAFDNSDIELELLDHQAELTEYMVSDEDLANLHQLIDDFENSLLPRSLIALWSA